MFDGVRRRYFRRYLAVLVAAGLTYAIDTGVFPATAGNTAPRRLLVALLSAAALAILGWTYVSFAKSLRLALASYLGLASASALPRSRQRVLDLRQREVTARYGPAVWPHVLRQRRATGVLGAVVNGFLLLYFVFANFLPDSGFLLIVGVVAVIVGAVPARIARRETELQVQAIEAMTGVLVPSASSLPWRPDDYVAWCLDRRVEPYPHGRPAPADQVPDDA